MKRIIGKVLFSTVILLFARPSAAQRHEIHDLQVSSLQVVAGDDWLSMPVIPLNQGIPVRIGFDVFGHAYRRLAFRVEHCEADWSVSKELFESDFVEGFASGSLIEETEQSINTNTLYTHYRLELPNEQCRIKLSGNYKVTVYDDDNGGKPLLTACFMVVEPQMNVSMGVTSNTDIDINRSHQQVSMQLDYAGLRVTNPSTQIKTVVLQNGRWDNARINVPPQYVLPNGLKWEHNRQYIFEAGNEFRRFEVLDPTHPTLGVDHIEWDGVDYNVFLFPDEPRPNYLYDEDTNGSFYIRNSDNIENDRLTDYVLVHFLIPGVPKTDGEVYINGTWTNNRFLPRYRMTYDETQKSYHATIKLKQGYYSYQYLLVTPDGKAVPMPSEGSFFQTENTYQALVYYREPGDRTDRLVGYSQVQFR